MTRACAAALALILVACGPAVPRSTGVAAPTASPASSAAPGGAFALFDAHVHYSQPAWELYSPDEALAMLARAGVKRALVSSTPDEGTWRLYERAPSVVVPFLRPYRVDSGVGAWARDGTTVAYVKSIYRPGLHRGIGEIHLAAGESELPVVLALIDMAVTERIWLQIHTDARGIDEVMRGRASGTRVLWAHAGQFASPAEIARLLDRYPTLWTELAGRNDIAPGGVIDPAWRDLFTRYPDRFMVGSDTWINPQWENLAQIEATNQAWLAQLPTDVAARIANGNAEVLFR